jgi:hypothetical protein
MDGQLEVITLSLARGVKQLVQGTWQTVVEVMAARRTQQGLGNSSFYTANFAMYTVEDGEVILYLGGREANPILANLDEACRQLVQKRDYIVPEVAAQAVRDSVESGYTLRVEMQDLELKTDKNGFSYFSIETDDYDRLNPTQRAVAERIYDTDDNFVANMQMLADTRIPCVKVYVLNPEYVAEHAQENDVVRACFLDDYYNSCYFIAYDWAVHTNNTLLGVRVPPPE